MALPSDFSYTAFEGNTQAQVQQPDESPRQPRYSLNLEDLPPTPGRPLSTPQMIERIIALNPSATSEFLERFRPNHLSDYLDHLVATREPRGRSSARWVRRGDACGIVTRTPRD